MLMNDSYWANADGCDGADSDADADEGADTDE